MKFARTALLAGCASVIAAVAHAETFNIQTSFNAGDFSTQYLTENWLPKIKERTDYQCIWFEKNLNLGRLGSN